MSRLRLVLWAAWIGQVLPTTLNVACRAGLPPFADVVDGKCVGIMAELFGMSAKLAGFNYTITPINYVATAAVTVNSTTNRSPFDMAISFNTVTPDRLLTVDFSMPIGEFGLAAMIHPKYSKGGINLIEALTGTTILYLLAVKALIIICSSLIVGFSELYLVKTSPLKEVTSNTKRIALCFESTFQVFQFSNPSGLLFFSMPGGNV
jgi:hypothetical protein